jgi:beta-xylosidase
MRRRLRSRNTATLVSAVAATAMLVLVAIGGFEWMFDGGATAFDAATGPAATTTEPSTSSTSATVPPSVRVETVRPTPPTTTTAAPLTPERAQAELAARSIAGGPALVTNAPDPMILRAGGSWYLYATGSRGSLLQVWRSSDLVSWQRLAAPLTALPAWSSKQAQWTWAPVVAILDDGTYAMYYTTRAQATKAQCISVATATDPAGPFVDSSVEPLVCQASLGGSIDPSVFVDVDGTRVLLWKSDGNCCSQHTHLWSQRLAADGRSLVGKAVSLFGDDQPWEGGIVEAPSMWIVDGVYHVLYSANRWDTEQYGIGQAVCESAAGPCEKQPGNAASISARGAAVAPGGAEFVAIGGRLWIVHHTWSAGRVGVGGGRSVLLTPLTLDTDGWLRVA